MLVTEQSTEFIIDDIHRGITVNPERENLFRDKFLGGLRSIGIQPKQFDRERLHYAIKATFEAIANTYDHADRFPCDDRAAVSSRLSMVRINSVLLIRVSDTGNGIAARHTLNAGIYRGPIETEAEAVLDAIHVRSSVKLRVADCRVRGTPGFGFTYLVGRNAGDVATLKTGRLVVTLANGCEPAVFTAKDAGEFMQGTMIEIVVPIKPWKVLAGPMPTYALYGGDGSLFAQPRFSDAIDREMQAMYPGFQEYMICGRHQIRVVRPRDGEPNVVHLDGKQVFETADFEVARQFAEALDGALKGVE